MDFIPRELFHKKVSGVNVTGDTLAAELGQQDSLLIFLRHFGCIFCRELVRDIRSRFYSPAGFIPTVFFFQAEAEEGVKFFNTYWPEARGIADPERQFYRGFGLEQARIDQIAGPEPMVCGLRAAAKGNWIGKPVGDVRQMPGMFLVNGSVVTWQHRYRHAGDHPDLSQIPRYMPV